MEEMDDQFLAEDSRRMLSVGEVDGEDGDNESDLPLKTDLPVVLILPFWDKRKPR